MADVYPEVVFKYRARKAFLTGFNQIADLLALTLGPVQGIAMHTSELKPVPEPITDAATMARRITSLGDRAEDVGAMLLRSLVWRVHQRVGDGTATTAVLAQAILKQASKYIEAGANPVRVQAGIEQAVHQASAELQSMAVTLTHRSQLAAVAYTATRERDVSFILSEMFDLLGGQAHITIEDYMAPYLDREYIHGGQWQAKLISPYLLGPSAASAAVSQDCRVALYHGTITDSKDILAVIEQLGENQQKNLLLVAHKITGEALSTFVATYVQNKPNLQLVAADLTRPGERALNDLQDLALLTGAKLINPDLGEKLSNIRYSDMGFAHRAEVGGESMFVTGKVGASAAIQEQITSLRRQLERLDFDSSQAEEIKMRLGRLTNSSAILKIGAYNQKDRQILHQKALQGVQALHSAKAGGVVPGGGTAFLHCISGIERIKAEDPDLQMGARAVIHALRQPFIQLMKNGGVSQSGVWEDQIRRAAPGLIFDVLQGALLPAGQIGLLDSAEVLRACLETASSGARMALSTDVILLKKNPRVSYEP